MALLTKKEDAIRDCILLSVVTQMMFLTMGAMLLDGGQALQVMLYAAAAYWVGLGLMIVRRRGQLTKADKVLIRWGFLMLILVSSFVTQFFVRPLRTMNSECYKPVDPERWNASLDILSRPLESLDSVQRPAARVFEYYGRVMNGGHSLHFDVHGDSRDEELLRALKELGAVGHAQILAEAFFLRREARRRRGGDDYVSETIEQLDMQFGRLQPDIPELLARYFKAHPESFPT